MRKANPPFCNLLRIRRAGKNQVLRRKNRLGKSYPFLLIIAKFCFAPLLGGLRPFIDHLLEFLEIGHKRMDQMGVSSGRFNGASEADRERIS
jgi:hypothetical protein